MQRFYNTLVKASNDPSIIAKFSANILRGYETEKEFMMAMYEEEDCDEIYCKDILSAAFNWSSSSEGDAYWRTLYEKLANEDTILQLPLKDVTPIKRPIKVEHAKIL